MDLKHANHDSPSKKEEGVVSSPPLRKYPKLLPISEILKLESSSPAFGGTVKSPDPKLSCAVPPGSPSINNLNRHTGSAGDPGRQQDTTLTNGGISVCDGPSLCEGDSTILYNSGPGLAVSPHTPPLSSGTTEHAHDQGRSCSKVPTTTQTPPVTTKETPLPITTKEPSESPIPDTPPMGSPLMFGSGESNETNFIFTEASMAAFDFESTAVEGEKKAECDVSSPTSVHSWHTAPEVVPEKCSSQTVKEEDMVDGDISHQESKEISGPPQSKIPMADTSITQQRSRRANLRLSARKIHRLALNEVDSIMWTEYTVYILIF